jgi:hypothetical protein
MFSVARFQISPQAPATRWAVEPARDFARRFPILPFLVDISQVRADSHLRAFSFFA